MGLREGLQGLRDAVKEDGRSALEDATKPTISKVSFERAFFCLGCVRASVRTGGVLICSLL